VLQIEQNDNEERRGRGLTAVDIVALTFTTIVGLIIPPIAVLVLFMCILEMILNAVKGGAPAIKNDRSIYRRFIRPAVRVMLWGPVAAIIVVLLLFLAVAIKYFALPLIPILLLFLITGGFKSFYGRRIAPRTAPESLTPIDENSGDPSI